MKIHKYRGKTENEAMQLIKEELGSDALIVSVKQVKPRGLMRWFKKPYIEITAAMDDRNMGNEKVFPVINLKATDVINNKDIIKDKNQGSELDEFKQFIEKFSLKQKEKQSSNEEVVHSIEESIENSLKEDGAILELSNQNELTDNNERDKTRRINNPQDRLINKDLLIEEESIEETPTLKLIYEQLIDNEVDEPYANELMNGLAEYFIDHTPDIDEIVAIVYKRMVKNLSDLEIIDTSGKNKPIFFIGPTGVGKTTTIAKIASLHTLIYNREVALITADTYRIAAVEQLRTYANILGIPIKVVYSKDELVDALEYFSDKDLVLVDTAGRSHKNQDHQNELYELLKSVEDKNIFLTLSVATKYKDLIKIVNVYKSMCDFKIIFTKLDETLSYGNILNIKMATGAKLSYVTFGQNVPDDISELNPHQIAKNLLGGDDDGSSE